MPSMRLKTIIAQCGSAPLAQSAEHLTLNQAVEGSIPSRRIGNKIHGIRAGAGIW